MKALETLEAELAIVQAENAQLLRAIGVLINAHSVSPLMGSLAHELAQPLSATRINLFTLRATPGAQRSNELVDEVLGRIDADTDRAIDIVTRLQRVFQTQAVDSQRFSISKTIEDIVVLTQPDWDHRNIGLTVQLEPDVYLSGNEGQLRMVVLDILRHAGDLAKQQQNSLTISLSRSQLNQTVLFEVSTQAPRNTGVCIETSPFNHHQDDLATTDNPLLISKLIVQRHHGSLNVYQVNQGARIFSISLPISAV